MYHDVTRDAREPEMDGSPETVEAEPSARPDAGAKDDRKERVLHTRVPAVLEAELKRFAQNLRVPVSNLVRTILEDAVQVADAATENVESRLKQAARQLGHERERLKKKVSPDPLRDVYAYQDVTLAQQASCAKCSKGLVPGDRAHLGLSDAPRPSGSPRLFVCDDCVPRS